ncbi:Hypothetical protein BIBO1_3044 [Brucella inopinata BO1]|uniref:tail terminator n=1 Tax=Brucella phage BiPBO1 TaxID=1718278 RepID=UPI0001E1611D|nr:DUF3168 domain-containing protein [Brucella inopinata]YP_009304039.1 tail terminator [Brucella phage BiPBO1]ALJ98225.1 hypothetical protein BiPBO1_11 [Brucella phage BiPBO1]EFM55115.1 Hypothetical protein BIBO1_3044 [Brucella inopinata BO1]KEY04148.1 hypothetical protein IL59_0212165 [Brucella suis bv. 4 str. 40]
MNISEELQRYLYAKLRTVPEVTTLAGGRVYDRVPEDKTFPYISFGPSDIVDDGAECIEAETHTIQLDAWSRAVGKGECKNLVDGVKKALQRDTPELSDNAIVEMTVPFTRVVTDPDGLTTHGIIQVEIRVEIE